MGFAVVLLIWTLTPIYNMVMVSLEPHGDVFTNDIWPAQPSLESFWVVVTEGYWYLENFWHQFGNSLYIGVVTVFLTLAHRLAGQLFHRPDAHPPWLALEQRRALDLCDPGVVSGDPVLPDHAYLRSYQQSLVGDRRRGDLRHALCDLHLPAIRRAAFPIELDEAARIDGASPLQVYFRIYLPLMAPALVAVGTYALLLAWNEYLYQFLLLSSKRSMTVPVALGAVPQQRRVAMELHDGDRHRLRGAAGRDLLRRSAAA